MLRGCRRFKPRSMLFFKTRKMVLFSIEKIKSFFFNGEECSDFRVIKKNTWPGFEPTTTSEHRDPRYLKAPALTARPPDEPSRGNCIYPISTFILIFGHFFSVISRDLMLLLNNETVSVRSFFRYKVGSCPPRINSSRLYLRTLLLLKIEAQVPLFCPF